MPKIRFICQTAIMIMSAVILAGCGKTEIPKDTEDRTEISQDSDAEEASPVYEIYTRSGDIEWAVWSEGIYCYSDGDLCGYVKDEGGSITPCIYEEAAPFSEGLACVRLDGKYGYIGKGGETVLPFVYDQASSFREGIAYFSRGEEYGLIDQEGNVVLELTDCDSISSFREGLAYFSVDGRYGYMDKKRRGRGGAGLR